MNPLGTRARADELDRVLAGALGGAALAPGVAAQAAVAARLQALGSAMYDAAAPRAEFRAALRTRLVAVAGVQAATAGETTATRARALDSAVSWSQSRRAQRGIGLAAGAMASVVAVAGIAVAGSQSLPGDPFYSVKRGGEALELRTAGGDVARGSKHLQFAAERLKEVRELTLGRDAALGGGAAGPVAAGAFGGSVSKRVAGALADMDTETRKGSALLTDAYRSSHSDAPLQILSRFAGRQTRDLQQLLPALPSNVRPRAASSLALVSGVAVQASELLAVGVCTGQCSPAQAAPSVPPTGGPDPQPAPTATTSAPCGCQPVPARTADPSPAPSPSPAPTDATPSPTPQPTAAPSHSPRPTPSSSPLPVPLPSSSPLPLPIPLPTGLPTPLPPVPGLPAAPSLPDVTLPSVSLG